MAGFCFQRAGKAKPDVMQMVSCELLQSGMHLIILEQQVKDFANVPKSIAFGIPAYLQQPEMAATGRQKYL